MSVLHKMAAVDTELQTQNMETCSCPLVRLFFMYNNIWFLLSNICDWIISMFDPIVWCSRLAYDLGYTLRKDRLLLTRVRGRTGVGLNGTYILKLGNSVELRPSFNVTC